MTRVGPVTTRKEISRRGRPQSSAGRNLIVRILRHKIFAATTGPAFAAIVAGVRSVANGTWNQDMLPFAFVLTPMVLLPISASAILVKHPFWSLRQKQKFLSLFLFLPSTVLFGILAALAPDYFFVFLTIMIVGLTTGGASAAISFAQFGALGITLIATFWVVLAVTNQTALLANLLWYTNGSGVLIFLLLATTQMSRQLQAKDRDAQRLLLGSRKDKRTISEQRAKSDRLLLNILPEEIATELKAANSVRPVRFESASVLFTDFKGFTNIAEGLSPENLVAELDRCFSYFDAVTERHNLEKLKTIGDSFMCAGGIPIANKTHAIDCVLAAMEIQAFMNQMKALKAEKGLPYWELRLGIHSGPLVAGVIGERKFAYDVWGDTVNTASRAESSGAVGRINITGATYELVNAFFDCEHRGTVPAKNKGEIDMYFVIGIRPELSRDGDGRVPGVGFQELLKPLLAE